MEIEILRKHIKKQKPYLNMRIRSPILHTLASIGAYLATVLVRIGKWVLLTARSPPDGTTPATCI